METEKLFHTTTLLDEFLFEFTTSSHRHRHSPLKNNLSSFVILTCTCILLLLHVFLPFSNHHRIVLGILLLLGSVLGLLLLSVLLSQWNSTLEIGNLLLQRIVNTRYNWTHTPFKSFFECCGWCCIVLGLYISSSRCVVAMSGSVIGSFALLISDLCTCFFHVMETRMQGKNTTQQAAVQWCKNLVCVSCSGYLVWGIQDMVYRGYPVITSLVLTEGQRQELHNMIVSYCLLMMVCISLIVAGELLMLCGPTRMAGIRLQSRVLHARDHWKSQPILSSVQMVFIFTTVAVMYRYVQSALLVTKLGTFASIVVLWIGDQCFASSTEPAAIDSEHWLKILPLVILGGFIGTGAIQWLFSHLEHIVLLLLLAVSSVLALELFSTLFSIFSCSQRWGECLHQRIMYVMENVRNFPIRTFVEFGCGVGVCIGTYAMSTDMLLAVWVSIVSSMTVILSGEGLGRCLFGPRGVLQRRSEDVQRSEAEEVSVTHTYLFLFIIVGFIIFNTIYTHLSHPMLAACLSTLLSTFFSVLAQWLFLWSPARMASRILNDRFVNTKKNWMKFPLRSAVELCCWLGVVAGTFWVSTNLFLACLFGTLSGVVVTLGGEVFRTHVHKFMARFMVHDEEIFRKSDRGYQTPSLTLMCVSGYGATLMLYGIYHNIGNIEIAFFLASVSGIVFVSASELLLLWKPTRIAGTILQDRVLLAGYYWKTEPLRSSIEIGCWLGTTYGSYATNADIVMSLQAGTFVAIMVTLSGEFFRNNLSYSVLTPQVTMSHTRPKFLPFILLVGYLGAGTFHWIFEHLRNVEVVVVLTGVTSFGFLVMADVLVLWKPTRVAGIILQDRVISMRHNWHAHPVRSFTELGVWLGVIYGSYALYRDFGVAMQYGTLSGMLVTLCGEALQRWGIKHQVERQASPDDAVKILPVPQMGLLGLFGALAFNVIYTHFRRLESALILATLTGITLVVVGDVFVFWRPTRFLGLTLQQRIVSIRGNWRIHPIRTRVEFSAVLIPLYATFGYTGNLWTAIQIGVSFGSVVCFTDELILKKVELMEQKLVTEVKQTKRYSMQYQATFLDIPYDVLFEIGRYLKPEELLLLRTCCRRVNDMVRAEAPRYWDFKRLMFNARLKHAPVIRSLLYEMVNVLRSLVFVQR